HAAGGARAAARVVLPVVHDRRAAPRVRFADLQHVLAYPVNARVVRDPEDYSARAAGGGVRPWNRVDRVGGEVVTEEVRVRGARQEERLSPTRPQVELDYPAA